MPRPAAIFDRHDLELALAADATAVAEGLDRLRAAGFAIVAASNEPTVAAGIRTEREVQESDRLLAAQLAGGSPNSPVERFYWCPFSPDAAIERYRLDHPWRKPRPGMLVQAAEDLELDLSRSWVLAGRTEDVAAARAAGTRVAALRTIDGDHPDVDLAAAVDAVLSSNTLSFESEPALPEVEVVATGSGEPVGVAADRGESASEAALVPAEPAIAPARAASSSTPTASKPPRPTAPNAGQPDDSPSRSSLESRTRPSPSSTNDEAMRSAIRELTEELRQSRAGARDLSGGRVVALLLELGVLLAAVMGMLQVAEPMLFAKWMLGAILLQLAAIAMLLFERR